MAYDCSRRCFILVWVRMVAILSWMGLKVTSYAYYKYFIHQWFGKHWWLETSDVRTYIRFKDKETIYVCFFCRKVK